jgi:hypothetical protein
MEPWLRPGNWSEKILVTSDQVRFSSLLNVNRRFASSDDHGMPFREVP